MSNSSTSETPSRRATLAERLTSLMDNRHPDGLGPGNADEVAARSKDIASRSGGPTVSHQTVHNIRLSNSNPGLDTLEALARVFNVTVGFLLGETDAPPAQQGVRQPEAPSVESAVPSAATLAARLSHLFEVVHPRTRGPYTDEEVAQAVTDRGGDLSASSIAALRNGGWDDPTSKQLRALAEVFGVPVAFFFDDAVASKVSDDLALLNAFKEAGARKVALRTVAELDEEALTALVPVIEHLSRAGKRRRM
ncbi:helix-turn-helix transcriptional regulator [Streptomyces sp. NPDC001581]|uniref:helix-turn-helix transcriptional regulator n=1 Tax=Streptomyces sp. NPDC001581 TaxID=3154386 RepID=UPI003326F0D8